MPSRRLDGQVAIVTGGASGIGRAAARLLGAEGAQVAVLDVDVDGAAGTVSDVEAEGSKAIARAVDLADAAALDPAVQWVLDELGRIDILVNSAGISAAPHSSTTFTDEQYEAVMAINVRAPAMLTRRVGTHMVERGGRGRIVNLSSSAAFRATATPAIYAASKAAVNGLTRAAAGDLGRHGINVSSVAPGMTRTPMTADAGGDDFYDKAVTSGPLENLLHRVSEAEDVASTIVFLCLPDSRQITGQVIHTSAGLVV